MNDFDYYLQLNRLIDNALLHLLSSVAASERMLPTPRRNDILVHFLKPKLKDKEYKLVRKDVRAMLQVARRLNGNLERKLYALTALSESLGLTDLERLYRLFTYLEQQHGMPQRRIIAPKSSKVMLSTFLMSTLSTVLIKASRWRPSRCLFRPNELKRLWPI